MELTGQQHIGAPQTSVWNALNDPLILARCVPGCEGISKVSETEMQARVLLKIGPVRARFAGKIVISDVQAPHGCTLSFEGTGGAAGFAKGRSQVTLVADAGGTRLNYTVEASIGGKLGQIGGRLIDASARKMADEFFTAFNAALSDDGNVLAVSGRSMPASAPPLASTLPKLPATPVVSMAPFSGGFKPELYRVFWFACGAGFTLLISRLAT